MTDREFQGEVIDRLARIETSVCDHLAWHRSNTDGHRWTITTLVGLAGLALVIILRLV